MKITRVPQPGEKGMALLVTLFLCTILSISIAGYLLHSRQQNYLSVRSQVWNLTMGVTEAGIEEGMEHLNTSPTNLTADGWQWDGSTKYSMTRSVTPTTGYTVTIDAANMLSPTVSAVANISNPSLAKGPESTFFAASTAGTISSGGSSGIQRAVKITAGKSSLFMMAMVAKHTINMNGNNVMTDSFDSTSTNYSNGGMYPSGIRSKIRNGGDVASNDSIVNAVNVGNADIYGHVSVGPGGTVSVGPNGGVGPYWWVQLNQGQIAPDYFSDDMNFTFESVTIPNVAYNTPSSGSVTFTDYSTYTVTSNALLVTTNVYPTPPPATGVQTNLSYNTVSVIPVPIPAGTVTNVLSVATSSKTPPAMGTYVGAVTVRGSKYYYNLITGTNYTYPITTYTYSSSLTQTNYATTSGNYDYILYGSSDPDHPAVYQVPSINNANVLVMGGYATFIVTGDVSISGQNGLTIAPDSSLKMYVGGSSISLGGNGVMNKNGYARNFKLLCADSVTSLSISGNGEFTGCIYAPNAAVRLNGGGNSDQDFVGALVGNTITMNGHYSFHYDESLRSEGDSSRYVMQSWQEISLTRAGN